MKKINMQTTHKIIRPPFEARSKYIEVTGGCSHNGCKYCNYYENIPFKISSDEKIIKELEKLRDKKYSFKRLWLLSADPFTLDSKKLIDIAKKTREYLPFLQSIGCYARIDSLKNKSVEDLNRLHQSGYDKIVIGTESGDDNLLDYMNKGYTSDDIISQLAKIDESSMNYTLIFLNGLGGHDYGLEHAIKTASIFNRFNPERIMINSLTIKKNTKLAMEVKEGIFTEMTPEEKKDELITFIDNLKIDTFIDATNESNDTPFFGQLQKNKEKMIKRLKE